MEEESITGNQEKGRIDYIFILTRFIALMGSGEKILCTEKE